MAITTELNLWDYCGIDWISPSKGFPTGSVKNRPATAGDSRDAVSIPGSGRYPRGGNGNPLQYSCLEYSMDRGAWQATFQGVTKSRTGLSTTHICTQFKQSLKVSESSLLGFSVCGILQARILEKIPSPGDLPNLGTEPRSLELQANSSPSELPGKPLL